MKDVLIPVVFPDYRISVETPSASIDVLPYFEFDNFKIEKSKQKLSNLGHAGILLINGRNGLTKYYEYGRYDAANRGIVRRIRLPDAEVNQNGVIPKSLIPPLRKISRTTGKGGRIEGVFIEAEDVFEKVHNKLHARKQKNGRPDRTPYSVTSNSCIHFVKRAVEAAGKETPWMVDPRPNSYIGEFRDDYRDLDYSPKTKTLKIEEVGEIQE